MQFNTSKTQLLHSSPKKISNFNSMAALDQMVKVDINVTAPNGYDLPTTTPIIIKLSEIAANLPISIDPFGMVTPEDSDDIKWDAAYVTYGGSLIPSQVDDVDNFNSYTEDDELVFALPESVSLTSGESASFSVYFGMKDLNLPAPYFPEVCTLTIYPDIKKVNDIYPDMLGFKDGVYYIGNGIMRAAVLKAAAWSTGGMYHLDLLDEQGESRWDIIKQKFPYPSEIWKWSRFALIDQFAAQVQFASKYPGKVVKMITGPVRARITIQSTQPYVSGAFGDSLTQLDGVLGLFTYDLFANQTYLDYSLDITGAKAGSYDELPINFQNREWGGGRVGTLYKGIYVPGTGWKIRAPDDTDIHKVTSAGFSSPWYLEALYPEGETVRPPSWNEPDEDPYKGYGFIFDDTGFTNITWDASSEDVATWYDAAQFPLNARYHPFDKAVLDGQDKVDYMEDKYLEWVKPAISFDFNSSIIPITEIPFDYIFASAADTSLDIDAEILQIENVTAFATDTLEFLNSTNVISATYKIYFFKDKTETGLSGNLLWNNTSQTWRVNDLDVSSLDPFFSYEVVTFFETDTLTGRSPASYRFGGGKDIFPPRIGVIVQTPEEVIRYNEIVNISVSIDDDEGVVKNATLSYSNGSLWYNVTMQLAYGTFTGSIPPQNQGTEIQYKIIAYDDATPGNFNTSAIFKYIVVVEYSPLQSIVPLTLVGGVLIVAIFLALRSRALHRQKYDQVD
jgi:hypothetical protein